MAATLRALGSRASLTLRPTLARWFVPSASRYYTSFAYLNFKGELRGNYMLDLLCKAGHTPAIVIEEDSKLAAKGAASLRGELLKVEDRFPLPREMSEIAAEYGLKVASCKNHNDVDCERLIRESGVDMIILGDCRIIKEHIINSVPNGVVNVHPGYLPDVKGNNTYIWSIHLDLPCGVTVHYIDTGVDTGPIIYKERLNCDWQRVPSEGNSAFTLQELFVEVYKLCGKVLVEGVNQIKNGTVKLEHQTPSNPDHTFRLAPDEVRAAVEEKLKAGKYDGNNILPQSERTPKEFIFRSLADVQKAGNHKKGGKGFWESARYLTRGDNCGFSMHHTIMYKDKPSFQWYKNHVEGVFVMKGHGSIEIVDKNEPGSGTLYELKEGDFYCLRGEKHILTGFSDGGMHIMCVFNPPVAGTEDHNQAGIYPAVDDEGKQNYEFGAEQVPALFKAPEIYRHGSKWCK